MSRVIHDLEKIDLGAQAKPVALTFGSFDGLHRGHRALVERVRSEAARRGGMSAVLSFSNHPLSVLAPPYCPKLLITPERKIEILEQLGVDVIALPEFTRAMARIPAEAFIQETLVKRFALAYIICGHDCRFGEGGRGDAAMLQTEGVRRGFDVEILEPLREDSAIVSSRLIRELLLIGDVGRAAELLERPHELDGIVVRGEQIGRTLGFPTANLTFPDDRLIPANGVYAVRVDVRGRRRGGMMNLGYRPTFGAPRFSPEVHLFEFDDDIYGETMRVYFLSRLRGEQKFDSIDSLRRQLVNDREAAEEEIKRRNDS